MLSAFVLQFQFLLVLGPTPEENNHQIFYFRVFLPLVCYNCPHHAHPTFPTRTVRQNEHELMLTRSPTHTQRQQCSYIYQHQHTASAYTPTHRGEGGRSHAHGCTWTNFSTQHDRCERPLRRQYRGYSVHDDTAIFRYRIAIILLIGI